MRMAYHENDPLPDFTRSRQPGLDEPGPDPLTLAFRNDGHWGESKCRNRIVSPIDEKAAEQNVADNGSVFFRH